MADEEENEEISLADLEDEEPKAAEKPQAKAPAKPPPVSAPSAKPAAPQVGLKDLEAHLANERAERLRVSNENARLLAERDNAIRYAQAAEQRGVSTIELANDNQIVALTEQLDMMQAQHEQAMTDGDFKTASALQRKMGKLNSDLSLAEERKAALAGQREQMTQQHKQPLQRPTPAAPPPVDPLERAIANRTEPTKAFLRKHRELIRDDGSLKRSAIDAHDQALDAGHAVDTPGYFSYIENVIGPGAGGNGAAGDSPAPRQRAPSMAAPVERGAAPGSGGGEGLPRADGTFIVTPKMRRLAEEQGVPIKEWAQNYVRLLREGRITPIT
jgi:hypothetical protein